jgi:hypothetical protein
MAMLLDPRMKSAIGIPATDCDAIWQYHPIKFTMSWDPIALAQPVLPQAQSMNCDGNHNH